MIKGGVGYFWVESKQIRTFFCDGFLHHEDFHPWSFVTFYSGSDVKVGCKSRIDRLSFNHFTTGSNGTDMSGEKSV